MALPNLNPDTKNFQEQSLKNQAEISSKIDSGISSLGKELSVQSKSLGRIDKWLAETYELHREYYQAQDELMREQKRAFKAMAIGAGYVSGKSGGRSGKDESQTNDVIDSLSDAVDKLAAPLLALYGTKKAAEVAKSVVQAKGAKAPRPKVPKVPEFTGPRRPSDFVGPVRQPTLKLKPGSIAVNPKTGTRMIVGVDGKFTTIEAEKAKPQDIERIKKAAAKIEAENATKVAEKTASSTDEIVKIARKATPLTKLTKVFNAIFPPLAIAEAVAVNAKDAWDIASAGLDNDIATEIQKEDIGGVVGGAIGGAIGIIGGPLGIAFGASIGNMIGEYIGKQFDDDFTDNFAIANASLDSQFQEAKDNLTKLNDMRSKGLISENKYIEDKIKIEQDLAFFQQMDQQRSSVDVLLAERKKAADEYNRLAKELKEQENSGKGVDQSLIAAVEAAKKSFEVADKKFDDAAKRFEREFVEEMALEKAKAKGIYEKVYFGKSRIDMEKAEGATLGELRAILADNDLGLTDKRNLQNLIARRTGTPERIIPTPAEGLQASFNKAVDAGDSRAMSEIISGVQQMGGASAVAALTKGNLTDAMLRSPKAQTASRATSGGGPGGINYQTYAMRVAQRESSNQYGITGGAGGLYLGKYQLGAQALEDIGLLKAGSYKRDGGAAWKNPDNWVGDMNAEKFLNSRSMQETAMRKYTNKNLGYLRHYGAISDASTPEEVAGLLAASHLLGARDVATKGFTNTDAFGTTGTEYYRIGAGSQRGSGGIGPSNTGSVSGGTSGYLINAGSKTNAAMNSGGGQPIVVNNNNIDNSQRSSVSQTTAMTASPERRKNTGVRYDWDPVGYGM